MKNLLIALVIAWAVAGSVVAETNDLVEVVGRNIGWTCRETAEGRVVDFTNKVGLVRVKGRKPRTDLRNGWSHVAVTDKKTGLDYNFALYPTGTLSVVLNDKMPRLPACFNDDVRYVRVNAHRPFDLSVTANRDSQRVLSNRHKIDKFFIRTVPSEMYTRGWVLCSVSDDPKKERTFTVRITRWVDDSEWNYSGRGIRVRDELGASGQRFRRVRYARDARQSDGEASRQIHAPEAAAEGRDLRNRLL